MARPSATSASWSASRWSRSRPRRRRGWSRVSPRFTDAPWRWNRFEPEEAQMSQATMTTNHGEITFELFDEDAPKTVENFRKLSRDGFYDGLGFHRIISNFMIQGGCPQGTGTGGPGYTFEDEINQHKIVRGALAMANAGPNTNGSQFFIVTVDQASWLDGKHTVFGHVNDGMEVVDAIEGAGTGARHKPAEDAVIESVELSE